MTPLGNNLEGNHQVRVYRSYSLFVTAAVTVGAIRESFKFALDQLLTHLINQINRKVTIHKYEESFQS